MVLRAPLLRILLVAVSGLPACECGGNPAVCHEPRQPCGIDEVSAVDVYSKKGCVDAIENIYCGVEAQALAECLDAAAVCVPIGSTYEAIAVALAASVCAATFADWDGCWFNGEAGGGGDGDIDIDE